MLYMHIDLADKSWIWLKTLWYPHVKPTDDIFSWWYFRCSDADKMWLQSIHLSGCLPLSQPSFAQWGCHALPHRVIYAEDMFMTGIQQWLHYPRVLNSSSLSKIMRQRDQCLTSVWWMLLWTLSLTEIGLALGFTTVWQILRIGITFSLCGVYLKVGSILSWPYRNQNEPSGTFAPRLEITSPYTYTRKRFVLCRICIGHTPLLTLS